ncbi:site-specific DNA-methyltransferase [Helicobacter acinonychis]|uniref:site-specific DNA-methyltransferase n=1 Tax=Helicobacter acinonychis TaxID=212 RepID=UPI00349FA47E
MKSLEELKEEYKKEFDELKENGIIETENAEFLKTLTDRAQSTQELIKIKALGTRYQRTGFHFDVRFEIAGDNTIKYFKKNEDLSFDNGGIKHKLIIGDNYNAINNLLIQYRKQIKVIYIDPPYGKDSMGVSAQTNYTNAIKRDNLLTMLYTRLQLAKRLLKDDGVIFCSIDDRNQAYVKCLFDEIFGEANFVANLIWQKKKGGSQDSQDFSKEHEYILCYQRRDWEILDETKEYTEADFNKTINGKKAKILKLEKWGVGSLRSDAPTLYYPIKDPNGDDFYPLAPNGQDGRWRKKPEILDENHIFWQENSKGRLTPYEVIYFDEVEFKKIKTRTIFSEFGTTTEATKEILSLFNEKKVFETPKPTKLMSKLIQLSANKDDIILDFFAGSGTTGHAVLELNRQDGGNRKFILATNNEKTEINPNGIAYDVTTKRLKRVMDGKCYDGDKSYKWIENNEPYGDSLEVLEMAERPNTDENIFDRIDESLYGLPPFSDINDKIDWVCENFEKTCQREIEND